MIVRITGRSLFGSVVAAMGVAATLAPAAASAATTTFGSSLDHSPANAGSTCAQDGVMGPALCTHVGSFYPGSSGRAAAPVSGTVTKIRLMAEGPTKLVVEIVKVRHLSANHMQGQAEAVAKSRSLNVVGGTDSNGNSVIESFNVNLKVQKGEELAVNTASNTAEYCSDGTPGQLLFDPVLAVGHGFRSSGGVDGCLMLVQGVIKH
jgi:hypothetical protein